MNMFGKIFFIILAIIIIVLSLLTIIWFGFDNYSCCDYLSTKSIDKKLYLEKYRTFCAGVFGELTECYLTDSVNFRSQIGSYDEHEFFDFVLKDNYICTYIVRTKLIIDTIDRIKLTKSELIDKQKTDSSSEYMLPLFGEKRILCDNYHHYYTYTCSIGIYISTYQYHCNNEYINAEYLTDSSNIKILIAFDNPGDSLDYIVIPNKKDEFYFYKTSGRIAYDTVESKKFNLVHLRKGTLKKVCKK